MTKQLNKSSTAIAALVAGLASGSVAQADGHTTGNSGAWNGPYMGTQLSFGSINVDGDESFISSSRHDLSAADAFGIGGAFIWVGISRTHHWSTA